MELKGVTDSTLSLFDIPAFETKTSGLEDILFIVIALALIIFSFLFRQKVLAFYTDFVDFLKNPIRNRNVDIQGKKGFRFLSGFLILVPVFAHIFKAYGFTDLNIWILMAFPLFYMFLKSLLLYLIGYVSGKMETAAAINRLSYAVFIVGVIIFLFLFLVTMLLKIPNTSSCMIADRIILSIIGVFYLYELVRIIFSSKVPLFLSFLYLCTLEFLPILMIIVTIDRI